MLVKDREFIRTVKFAFTLTINPQMYRLDALKQFEQTRYMIDNLNLHLARVTCVYELTKKFNIHYHGIIDFVLCEGINYRKVFIDHFRQYSRHAGREIIIKQIDDENGWLEYIQKDIPATFEMVDRYPVIRDDFELLMKRNTIDKYLDDDEIIKYLGLEDTHHVLTKEIQEDHIPTLNNVKLEDGKVIRTFPLG